jgi:hypothetical protein
VNAIEFAPGMAVYDREYSSLGKIVEVWVETPHGHLGFSRTMLENYGPVEGVRELLSAKDGFLQVRQSGVFSRTTDLFVPLSEVVSVDPPLSVTIQCSGEACAERFSQRPRTLQAA